MQSVGALCMGLFGRQKETKKLGERDLNTFFKFILLLEDCLLRNDDIYLHPNNLRFQHL